MINILPKPEKRKYRVQTWYWKWTKPTQAQHKLTKLIKLTLGAAYNLSGALQVLVCIFYGRRCSTRIDHAYPRKNKIQQLLKVYKFLASFKFEMNASKFVCPSFRLSNYIVSMVNILLSAKMKISFINMQENLKMA